MKSVYTHTFAVPESSIDGSGNVNNIEYIRWMQDVATAHTASGGWSLTVTGKAAPPGSSAADTPSTISCPAYAGERLDLHTWIEWVTECQSMRRTLLTRSGPASRARPS
ncbi:hypothetical protein [Chlorobaculum sp. 24CR]|uniref:hypothetical protein n=1 Tax=Chlorobaculum sp. 24CR TaxID=2508878 RepID=UPI001431D5A1|nr:hypothetical protein [Chlorobaculum sp. 24CR]